MEVPEEFIRHVIKSAQEGFLEIYYYLIKIDPLIIVKELIHGTFFILCYQRNFLITDSCIALLNILYGSMA